MNYKKIVLYVVVVIFYIVSLRYYGQSRFASGFDAGIRLMYEAAIRAVKETRQHRHWQRLDCKHFS